MNIKNLFDVHTKFSLEWQQLIGVHTPTWAPNTTKTWPFPTLTFCPHSNYLQKAWVMCLHIDLCIGLMLIDILIAGELVKQDHCRE